MPDGATDRFLIVRLSALGDILHTLPAAQALRESFPDARMDWLVDEKWAPILRGGTALDHVLAVNRKSWASIWNCVRELRSASYTCALDLQGLYKSAVLAALSGAPRRIGFDKRTAREGGAAVFYTEHVQPTGRHVAEHNLSVVARLGAGRPKKRFALSVNADADERIETELRQNLLDEFYVFSPGGSWRAKCWPPERFGELCRELEHARGWRGVMILGPNEQEVGEAVLSAAAPARPTWIRTNLVELVELVRRARFLVGVDSGPLHLAVAVGTPVIGLYGPTDPARNGPFCDEDVVVRNARPDETSYKRRAEYSRTMLSIRVEQVIDAIDERLAKLPERFFVRAREGA